MYIIICLCIIYLAPSFSTNISERYNKKTFKYLNIWRLFMAIFYTECAKKKLNNE